MPFFKSQVLKSSLAITTIAGCRNQCSYCPQKSFVRSYRRISEQLKMSMDTFRKCITTVPLDVCLSFSGFCEPWLNPDCTRMILHAHEKGFRIRVNTTLVGMSPEDVHQIKTIPFVKFVVHLPDDSGLTHIKTDDPYHEVLKLLIDAGINNMAWKFHKSRPGIDVLPEVKRILKISRCHIRYAGLNNRAGNINAKDEYISFNRGSILQPCQDFNHNILLPNGGVTLCHMDWSLQHILGNLTQTSYADLFHGRAFQELNKALCDPESDILCRHCEKDIVRRNILQNITRYAIRKVRGKRTFTEVDRVLISWS